MPLRNADYTDRELLLVVKRCTDNSGVASSEDIAEALGIKTNGNGNGNNKHGKSAAGRVSSRLSWMARYGFIERADSFEHGRLKKEALWIITPVGMQLMGGKLTKSVQDVIERNDPGTQLLIMRSLTRRSIVQGSDEVATAVRREYLHNAAQRLRT